MTAPELRTRRVRLCGGPLHGQWIIVPEYQTTIIALDPAPVPYVVQHLRQGEDPTHPIPEPQSVTYLVKRLPVSVPMLPVTSLWIGVLASDGETRREGEAIARAILRDDVAQQLLGEQ